ncbi:Choline transport protein [Vanrija pseudolonga]|uniref:Choline transport protein n=1 Tax=Vanrija pseudolonga TaxID=143232 RepID=A0AAF0YEX2_9TREE|nr:Choline transport protein [Vanrija pseudolonga]
MSSHDAYDKDEKHIKVGVEPVHSEVRLERRFSFLSCLGLAFILLNSWTAATSVLVQRPTATGARKADAHSAELCHVYPMVGGQYDWTYLIAPTRMKNSLSFLVGWCATAGWVTLTATDCGFNATFIQTIIAMWSPSFDMKNWMIFLLFLAFGTGSFLLNTFGIRILPAVEESGFYWGVGGIVTVSVVVLACSHGEYRPAKQVFGEFTNVTGWPDGMAFLIGLLQSCLGLAGYDAVTHVLEETPFPSRDGPRVIMWAVGLGAVTSWIFLVILVLVIKDLDKVISSPAGPLLEIYLQATRSPAGSTCLVLINLIAMLYALQSVNTIASRMLFTLSRDRSVAGLSPYLAPVHLTLKVPVWSLVAVFVCSIVLGTIYLGSTVAFNAIAGSSMFFLNFSYIVPLIILVIRGEKVFDGQPRRWSLGRWRRIVNLQGLAYLCLTSVVFLFPPALPVTGTSMNYIIVVVVIVFIMTGLTWVFDGRKRFHGPSHIEERLLEGRSKPDT